MNQIDDMLDIILKHEGGFVNDPLDRGGATNFGITQKTYSGWMGRQATVAEVRSMDIETAKEIYKSNYYYAPRINAFAERVQPLVFDCAVNHGPRRAIKFVQAVCNLAGFNVGRVDGTNGPRTQAAAAEAYKSMGNYFINAIVDERIDFYHRIVARNLTQQRFLTGWLKRAESFRVKTGVPTGTKRSAA